MKISLNWLREYIKLDYSPQLIADILTEIGLEVEGFEEVEQIKGSLRDLVVGEVLTCQKHPNADRLFLTTVNIGSEILQIVCGAPNVAVGQKVVVAPAGTRLFDRDGNPYTINKGKIRGEISEGMICAEDEIGLSDDHMGILVLDDHFSVGNFLTDYFHTHSDIVYEIGLTPNRSDATSHIGIARDLLAALKINYNHTGHLKLPSVDDWKVENQSLPVEVEVLHSEGCPRYAGVTISNITVKESPNWLKNRLKTIGLRPINNIVDITNFILHELGQPLHAFDLNKIKGRKVKVQTLPADTVFLTLDEQERRLHEQDLMICDGEDNAMCIAGVFGGIGSGVDAGTKDIFLESAHFNARWIRRSSGRHLLYTDAAKIFEKGSDPNICVYALKRAALLIKELAGGEIASDIIDVYPLPVSPASVTLNYRHLNRLVGTDVDPEDIEKILGALEMEIIDQTDGGLTVAIPTNKVDVKREADLIEEVLRIYGYNRVPVSNRMSFSISKSDHIDKVALRNRAADYLYAHGFNEIMGFSMIDRKYIDNPVFQLEGVQMVRINNTSNVQVEVMRPDLLITALETVRHNQYRQQSDLRLFELGKSYRYLENDYQETDHLAITISGWHQESWLQPTFPPQNQYFALKSMVENVLFLFGIREWDLEIVEGGTWSNALQYSKNDLSLVIFGEVSQVICQEMDVRGKVFFADFHWNNLLARQKVDEIQINEPSRFPVVKRDLALVVNRETSFISVKSVIEDSLGKLVRAIKLFDVYRNEEVLGQGKKSYAVSILLSDSTKTFSDKEVDLIMGNLVKLLENEVGARLR